MAALCVCRVKVVLSRCNERNLFEVYIILLRELIKPSFLNPFDKAYGSNNHVHTKTP